MSTYPPPLPTSNSAAAGAGTAVDFGPVGTVPSGAGVVYFGERFGSRNSPMILMVVGGIGVLLGLFLLTYNIFAGVMSLVMGVLFGGLGWIPRNRVVHRDVVCDNGGITYREGTRSTNVPPIAMAWAAINSALCDSYTVTSGTGSDNSGETTVTHHRLTLRTAAGAVMTIDDANVKGLPELVALVDQHTPHLPYRWLLSKDAKGLPVEIDAGKYSRVPR